MNAQPKNVSAVQDDALAQGHETDAVNARLVVLSSLGLVLLMVGGLLIVYAAWDFMVGEGQTGQQLPSAVSSTRTTMGPQATADQQRQLQDLRQSERSRLNSYDWIDEKAGVARIPIDRAIDIMATQGLSAPVRPGEDQHDDNESE